MKKRRWYRGPYILTPLYMLVKIYPKLIKLIKKPTTGNSVWMKFGFYINPY